MTKSLEETRTELVADLEAASFLVVEHLDGKVQPPAVVIACGNPYLLDGELLKRDELQLNLDLFLVLRAAQRDAMTVTVNRAVQDLLLAIDDQWVFREASAPFRATNLNGNPPVCRVRLSTNVLITSEGN